MVAPTEIPASAPSFAKGFGGHSKATGGPSSARRAGAIGGVSSMKIFVKAKPGAKRDRVERVDTSHVRVWVRAPAEGGKANAAIEKSLADYLNIPSSRVRVTKGFASRAKVVEITRTSC